MVQYATPLLATNRRFAILIGVSDIVWGSLALIITMGYWHLIRESTSQIDEVDFSKENGTDMIGNNGKPEVLDLKGINSVSGWVIALLVSVLIFVIGLGVVLSCGALRKNPRLLLIWIIPNVIVMSILVILAFIGAFDVSESELNNDVLLSIIGFVLVRAVGVLKVFELYWNVLEKTEDQASAQLCNEMETETELQL